MLAREKHASLLRRSIKELCGIGPKSPNWYPHLEHTQLHLTFSPFVHGDRNSPTTDVMYNGLKHTLKYNGIGSAINKVLDGSTYRG